MITHNLGIVAEMTSRVFVMYAGQLVEESPCKELFEKPLHPYTEALLKSIPSLESKKGSKLYTIPGTVPNLLDPPSGCRFHPRCEFAKKICSEKVPSLTLQDNGRKVRCFLRGSEPEEVNTIEFAKSC
ncbi:ABC transporter ATP-binding protein [Pseudothermotoga thermarum]|uniref:ABC transporter ATP-binding protein n=1 Tax=Pseudothermotoga thermarum TaxID=119394 RepID=UPI001B7FA745|nr:ABC transporter ATP-binding protein [Pseudothermotoga thermarum]